jgi:predicted Co/Zn/Cd cation transporter (cation efflux family)
VARSGSALVALDAKAARLDMFLSAAVLLSFMLGWIALGTALEPWIDFLDPTLVTVLCLVALPVPLKVLWDNGRESLLLAPDPALQELVKEKIRDSIGNYPVADYRIRMLKMGNVLAVTLHLRPADDYRIEGIDDLDLVRRTIEDALAPLELEVGIDVMFVGDMNLAR